MKTAYAIGARTLLTIALATLGSAAMADDTYDQTMRLCATKTTFDTTALDVFVHYASYFSKLPLGSGRVVPLERAHIRDLEVFRRNFRAGLGFDFRRDDRLRRLMESDGFQRALVDCLPESKYANAKKLRAAFVLELASQQVAGKIAAGATFWAGGEVVGLAAGLLKGASRVVFQRLMIGAEVFGGVSASAQLIFDYIDKRRYEDSFPRAAEASRRDAKDDEIGRATLEDFKDITKIANASDAGLNDEADAQLDAAIALAKAKLARTTDPGERLDLEKKIRALTLARNLGH